MIFQTNRVIKVSTCWNGELTGSTVAHSSSSWTQHIQLTVLSYIHTHSYFNGSIREPLGLVSCPRIFGTQIGAARDRNKNHLLSGPWSSKLCYTDKLPSRLIHENIIKLLSSIYPFGWKVGGHGWFSGALLCSPTSPSCMLLEAHDDSRVHPEWENCENNSKIK